MTSARTSAPARDVPVEMAFLAALAASTVLGLSQPPYLGIACGGPNMTTCGRVGIAVWLRRPALRIDATVGGVSVRLHDDGLGSRYWTGYVTFRPAGSACRHGGTARIPPSGCSSG